MCKKRSITSIYYYQEIEVYKLLIPDGTEPDKVMLLIYLLLIQVFYSFPGAHVWIINLWPDNPGPALHLFHLSFGAGSFVAPLIAEPFLSTNATTSNNGSSRFSQALFKNESFLSSSPNHFIAKLTNASRVQIVYGIVSAFYLALVISMVALYCIDGTDFKPQKSNTTDSTASQRELKQVALFRRITLLLLAAYICVYVAVECTSGQMLTAYAVKGRLHFTKSSASRLTAVYFLCFTISRIVAAVASIRVTSFWMLVISHTILIFSTSVLFVRGSSSDIVLWSCSALLGFGLGPIYAAAVAWTVSYINITNKMMSLIIIMALVGGLSPPLLVGQFLDYYPEAFLYVCFVSVAFCSIMFIVMTLSLRRRPMFQPESEKDGNLDVEEAHHLFSL